MNDPREDVSTVYNEHYLGFVLVSGKIFATNIDLYQSLDNKQLKKLTIEVFRNFLNVNSNKLENLQQSQYANRFIPNLDSI